MATHALAVSRVVSAHDSRVPPPWAGLVRRQRVGDHEVLEIAVPAGDGPLDLWLGCVVGDWRPVAHETAVRRGAGYEDVRGPQELEVVIAERRGERHRHHVATGAGRVAVL
jgi:hypothetical protein